MLIANLPYLINFVIFILYLLLSVNKSAWPNQFVFWVWIPFIAHIWFHNFADGLQNTTRNIARIYLIKNQSLTYNKRLVPLIQTILVPDSVLPITIMWIIAHISSFSLILFFQGWASAILTEVGIIFLGGLIPIDYQKHLLRICKHAKNLNNNDSIALLVAKISIEDLIKIIEQAITKKLNPQKWWGVVLNKAIQTKIYSKQTNFNKNNSNY